MFDSGISQKDLIDEVIKEMDVAENIPYSKYEYWYNSLIQLLYSEIVKEGQSRTVTVDIENNQADIRLEDINSGDGTIEVPRFEDVTAVFVNGYELSRSTFISGTHLRNSYWSKGSDSITIWTDYGEGDADVEIRFNVRPKLLQETIKGSFTINDLQNYCETYEEQVPDDALTPINYKTIATIDLSRPINSRNHKLIIHHKGTGLFGYPENYNVDENISSDDLSITITDDKITVEFFKYTAFLSDGSDTGFGIYPRKYNYQIDESLSVINKVENEDIDNVYGYYSDPYVIEADGKTIPVYGVYKGYKGWLQEQQLTATIEYEYSFGDGVVPLPYEFTELVRCKLRGEAYKLINDDALAAKWIGEYNTLLENFKVYIASHGSMYGRY